MFFLKGRSDLRQVPVSPDDPLPVSASVTASIATTANAAAPTLIEGSSTNPISVDLSANLRVKDAAANAVLGTTAGAAVITDANGTIQQYLRGLIKQWIAGTLVLAGGATASGSAVANNPLTTGGRAATANPTAVADGQVVNTMLTKHGKVVVIDGAPRELKTSQNTIITASTSETTIVTAGAAGVFNDLYGLVLANTGATTTKVNIRDATGGSIITTFEIPTLETRGFMVSAGSALAQTTAANNWTAQCGSSTSSLEVTALFIKNT